MDYGALLRRAWEIVWNNKFLILLGVLVALGSGGGGGGNPGGGGRGGPSFGETEPGQPDEQIPLDEQDFEDLSQALEQWLPAFGALAGLGVSVILALVCIGFIVGIALWVVGNIAGGGLIAAVDEIERGGKPTFGTAWEAGWKKGWRLVGIALIPALVGLAILAVLIGMAVTFGISVEGIAEEGLGALAGGFIAAAASILCVGWIMLIFVGLLQLLANRACMLEDAGVMDAYGRAWDVLRENLGPIIVLGLIQIGISIGVGVLLFVPGIIMAFCCILWPLAWAINGAIETYFSTVWTLAWRMLVGGGDRPLLDAVEPTLG